MTVLEEAEQRLQGWIPALESTQNAYFSQNNRYFQLLPAISYIPIDGEMVNPDCYSTAPSDLGISWTQFASMFGITLPSEMMSNPRVDCYGGPLGQGWVLVAQIIIDGEIYERSIGYGPESRDSTWKVAG